MDAFPMFSTNEIDRDREVREYVGQLIEKIRNQTLAEIVGANLPTLALGSRGNQPIVADLCVPRNGSNHPVACDLSVDESGRLTMVVHGELQSEPIGILIGPRFKLIKATPFHLTIDSRSDRRQRRKEAKSRQVFALVADGAKFVEPLELTGSFDEYCDTLKIEAAVPKGTEEAYFIVEVRSDSGCKRRFVKLDIHAVTWDEERPRLEATVKEIGGANGCEVTVRSVCPDDPADVRLLTAVPDFASLPFERSKDGMMYFDFRWDRLREAAADPRNGWVLQLAGDDTDGPEKKAKPRKRKPNKQGKEPKPLDPSRLNKILDEKETEALKNGDMTVLAGAFTKLERWLLNCARKWHCSPEDAEDCLQEAFVKIPLNIKNVDHPILSPGWFKSQMRSAVTDRNNQIKKMVKRLGFRRQMDEFYTADCGPEADYDDMDLTRATVFKAIQELKRMDRCFVVLCRLWPVSESDGIALLGETDYRWILQRLEELGLTKMTGKAAGRVLGYTSDNTSSNRRGRALERFDTLLAKEGVLPQRMRDYRARQSRNDAKIGREL